MKIYLAGNSGHGMIGKYREDHMVEVKAHRLFSYFWLKEGFLKNFKRRVKKARENG